jgi:hypothetical protein
VFVTWIACAPPSFDPGSPAQASLPVMIQSEDRNSTFHGPSWIDPLFALSSPEGSAAATERSTLPAPLASWSDEHPNCFGPEGFPHLVRITIACRRRSVLCSWSLRCRSGQGRCPDHLMNMRPSPSRSKQNLHRQACG